MATVVYRRKTNGFYESSLSWFKRIYCVEKGQKKREKCNNIMSAGIIVNTLTYMPKCVRDFLAPPTPILDVANDPSKVQLERISHVYFQHPNLDKFGSFARDFGFVEAGRTDDAIYYRGYGRDQYVYVASRGRAQFNGVAFVAASQEDFDKAAQLPGASPKKKLYDAPGGGELVTFARPNRTFFHVIFGQRERNINTSRTPSETHESHGPFNTPFEKPRLGEYFPGSSRARVSGLTST